ncbi:RNA polymerase sigma-70 factor [Chitinophaga caeni]|uniref:RNA polymerase sigma-70 factor n=1 Tax=Chitinophaga caeni TaxID=2029983 RepID=A0A291QQD4_9BACT|nr:RNA polymerase sigma-70 factor [Chitinophaga caeni]ATL46146.1 RNA polymerase sigma-70 factor [Chitinophaga caeni]
MKVSESLNPRNVKSSSQPGNLYICNMPGNDQLQVLLKEDERRFMAALFKSYFTPACKTIYRFVQDMSVAEDLAQDVFIKIWNKRAGLGEVYFKAYIQRSAINAALDYLDKKKRRGVHTELEEENMQIPVLPMQGNLRETAAKIDAAVNELPEKCREVFILSRYEELSYKEIASTLNISVKTVENQVMTALKKLRVSLKELISN